jgi:AcrR family transcriptional regulator
MATNDERSASTRARLINAARELFARQGYAATGTEAILLSAGVQRGAMYHHFADKSALFEAVCDVLTAQALPAIDAATARAQTPLDALVRGSIAWVNFVTQDDVRQILLVDAPTVLGWVRWQALDEQLSAQALRDGVREAVLAKELAFDANAELLAVMANGALNALAMRVGNPATSVPKRQWHQAVRALWSALAPIQSVPTKKATAARRSVRAAK